MRLAIHLQHLQRIHEQVLASIVARAVVRPRSAMTRHCAFIALMAVATPLSHAEAALRVPATHPNVTIVGRHAVWGGNVHFDHPGVSFRVRLANASWATAKMSQVGAVPNAFDVYVDGRRVAGANNATFNTSGWGGEHDVLLFRGLDASSPHEVQFNACGSNGPSAAVSRICKAA